MLILKLKLHNRNHMEQIACALGYAALAAMATSPTRLSFDILLSQ